jgi:Ca2+-binding EF-hand superfamily protein
MSVREELLTRCKKRDTESTGFITTTDLKSILASLGEEMGDDDVHEMIDEAGCWQDTKTKTSVAYEKFIEALYADADEDQ